MAVRLTPRQQAICDLVMLGWTSKEIGDKLAISKRTVEFHRAAALDKFNARNTAELIRKLVGMNHV